jgi:hypothetical protein
MSLRDPDCHARSENYRTIVDCSRSMASLDLDAGLRVRLRALEVEGRVGTRSSARGALATDSRISGIIRGEYSVSSRVSIVSSFARVPSDLLRGLPARTQTVVGLRLQRTARHESGGTPINADEPVRGDSATVGRNAPPAASAFEVSDDRDGMRTISIVAPVARSVELTGDMTRWRIVAMTHESDGRWSVALRLPPGVYNCNVRIDGGPWAAPAGLPTSRDDFRGEVGVVVVE